MIRFILHRPRNAQNIGSAARALANTGAGALWVVEGEQYDRAQAARLAAGADAVLERMVIVRSLEEALAPCVDAVYTTGRLVEGLPCLNPRETARRLLASAGELADRSGGQDVNVNSHSHLQRAAAPGAGESDRASTAEREVALVFGDEVRGLSNAQLEKASAIATIPTVEKASLNLAQSVLIFAYELMLARGNGRAGQETGKPSNREKQRAAHALARAQRGPEPIADSARAPDAAAADPALEMLNFQGNITNPNDPAGLGAGGLGDERLQSVLREKARALLLARGFLNPQRPDFILDELLRVLRRGRPSRRELELWIGAFTQLGR